MAHVEFGQLSDEVLCSRVKVTELVQIAGATGLILQSLAAERGSRPIVTKYCSGTCEL